MARPREPIALVVAKGKKNLTKAEIAARTASEVQPCTDEIDAPAYLTPTQKKRFDVLAGQLQKIKIMGETDVDTLARYVAAQSLYEQLTKELRALVAKAPKDDGTDEYYKKVEQWVASQEALAKQQDRYFKQAHTCASALGLTISSRCKLQVPVQEEAPRVNKFDRFKGAAGK